MIKKGYILFFTMVMLAMGTALITQIFYVGNLYNSYVSITLDREKARQIALGGVPMAMSQLMLLDKKFFPEDKEKKGDKKKQGKQDKRKKNQKKFLEVMLQVQNRWQTFILKHETDGIDAELKICISCENGKLDCNKFYNYDIHQFISPQGKDTKKIYKLLGEKLAPFLRGKNIYEGVTSFIDSQKRPMLTTTEFLKDKKLAQVFTDNIFYIPSEKNETEKNDSSDTKKVPQRVYLTDLFTVHGESTISMWALSPSLQKVFGLYSNKKMTPERAKEIVKKVDVSQIKGPDDLSRALEMIYGGKNNALPIEFLNTLNPKFEPRLFSVLCYAKVGRVGQKLLALLEKAPMKDGEIIKMIKMYWI